MENQLIQELVFPILTTRELKAVDKALFNRTIAGRVISDRKKWPDCYRCRNFHYLVRSVPVWISFREKVTTRKCKCVDGPSSFIEYTFGIPERRFWGLTAAEIREARH